jgi:hypothetical protein
MLVSLCIDPLVSRVLLLLLLLLLVAVLSDELPVVDCGGLQAPMAANTIANATMMFFIKLFSTTSSIPLPPYSKIIICLNMRTIFELL